MEPSKRVVYVLCQNLLLYFHKVGWKYPSVYQQIHLSIFKAQNGLKVCFLEKEVWFSKIKVFKIFFFYIFVVKDCPEIRWNKQKKTWKKNRNYFLKNSVKPMGKTKVCVICVLINRFLFFL